MFKNVAQTDAQTYTLLYILLSVGAANLFIEPVTHIVHFYNIYCFIGYCQEGGGRVFPGGGRQEIKFYSKEGFVIIHL